MIRKARFAGLWYPAEKEALEAITGDMQGSGPYDAAVLPHAGLMYSGILIRSVLSRIPIDTERVIILSPSHYFHLPPSLLATSSFSEAETPFGMLRCSPLDIPDAVLCNEAVAAEHGVEMFLPFIRRRGDISVSFGIISSLRTEEDASAIAHRIAGKAGERTVLIASSDFTHYGKRFGYTPYGNDGRKETESHDDRCAEMLAEGKGCRAYSEYRNSTICGIAAAAIAAEYSSQLGLKGERGDHALSSDISADSDGFVSYRTVMWRECDRQQ